MLGWDEQEGWVPGSRQRGQRSREKELMKAEARVEANASVMWWCLRWKQSKHAKSVITPTGLREEKQCWDVKEPRGWEGFITTGCGMEQSATSSLEGGVLKQGLMGWLAKRRKSAMCACRLHSAKTKFIFSASPLRSDIWENMEWMHIRSFSGSVNWFQTKSLCEFAHVCIYPQAKGFTRQVN